MALLLISPTVVKADTVIIKTTSDPVYELTKEYQEQAKDLRMHEVEQGKAYNQALFQELYGVPMPDTPYTEPPVVDPWEQDTEIIIFEDEL